MTNNELMVEFLKLLNAYGEMAGKDRSQYATEERQNIINFFQLGLEQGHFYEKHHHS